jgi:TOTE conflict system, Archaeo-Eukaryotic Primase domain/Primase C terminal 1 (PriCT-1)
MPTDTFPIYERPARFALLFDGLREAYGTGAGRWVKEPLHTGIYNEHLAGYGEGLGVAPLRRDNTVRFAAVDLDEPDFGFARQVASFLPGTKWIERSRSGNAHIWVFMEKPVEGWVPRGVMLKALEALGRTDVEVFPKQDVLRDGMLGNYINLPYWHSTEPGVLSDRPMVELCYPGFPERTEANLDDARGFPLDAFLRIAQRRLNDPNEWRRRARALGVQSPEERPDSAPFGERDTPHECAMYIYQRRHANPIQPGHRAVVLFSLAKQFLNWRAISPDRALALILEVNDAMPEPVPEAEVRRIVNTALRGQYTSTGCDDPLMQDYIMPTCKIGHPHD